MMAWFLIRVGLPNIAAILVLALLPIVSGALQATAPVEQVDRLPAYDADIASGGSRTVASASESTAATRLN
jgi:hypothetical protein